MQTYTPHLFVVHGKISLNENLNNFDISIKNKFCISSMKHNTSTCIVHRCFITSTRLRMIKILNTIRTKN
jgi:hypothetical protein